MLSNSTVAYAVSLLVEKADDGSPLQTQAIPNRKASSYTERSPLQEEPKSDDIYNSNGSPSMPDVIFGSNRLTAYKHSSAEMGSSGLLCLHH